MRKIKKIGRLTFLAFLVLLSFTLAGATLLVKQYYYPQEATVQTLSLETYIDGVLWTNGTTISWGTVNASETYTKNMTVKNTGTLTCNVTFTTQGLPSGWTQIWIPSGQILISGAQITGNLTLTVASDAMAGTFTWDSWINGEQV